MAWLLAGLLAGGAALLGTAPARAEGILSDDGEPDFLTMGVGYFDVFKDQNAGIFNLEYRSSKQFFYLRPHVGMFGTTDGGFYAYTGVRLDIFLGRRFVLSPNFSPGFYFEGNGKDLGFVMEFRSGLELGYRFDNRGRLTAAIHHLSNASLGDDNPGTETVTLYYSLPLDGILGNGEE